MILTFFELLGIAYYIIGLVLITLSKTGTAGEWLSYIFLAIGMFIYICIFIARGKIFLMLIFFVVLLRLIQRIWKDVKSCEKL